MDLRAQTPPQPDVPAEARQRRIPIADSNRDWANGLAVLLEDRGYSVHTRLRRTGYEAARVLARHPWTARLVLIAVTAWPREAGKLDAQFARFDRYFPKAGAPARILELLKAAPTQSKSTGLSFKGL